MEIIGPFILTIISGLSTLLGSLFIMLKIKRVEEYITFFLSLSMIMLLLIAAFELIPGSLNTLIQKYNIFLGIILSLLIILLGYQSIYFINKTIKNNNSLYKIGLVSLISLILHNIPEGIIVFMSSFNSIKTAQKLSFAIIIHNIVEGSLISIPLYYSGESRGRVILFVLISALSEPFGALLSYFILKDHISSLTISYISLFVSGLMISISLCDILKEIIKYNKKKYIIIGLVVGLVLSFVFLII